MVVGVGYLDLSVLPPADKRICLRALSSGLRSTEEGGSDALHDPTFYPGFIDRLRELIDMLATDLNELAEGSNNGSNNGMHPHSAREHLAFSLRTALVPSARQPSPPQSDLATCSTWRGLPQTLPERGHPPLASRRSRATASASSSPRSPCARPARAFLLTLLPAPFYTHGLRRRSTGGFLSRATPIQTRDNPATRSEATRPLLD